MSHRSACLTPRSDHIETSSSPDAQRAPSNRTDKPPKLLGTALRTNPGRSRRAVSDDPAATTGPTSPCGLADPTPDRLLGNPGSNRCRLVVCFPSSDTLRLSSVQVNGLTRKSRPCPQNFLRHPQDGSRYPPFIPRMSPAPLLRTCRRRVAVPSSGPASPDIWIGVWIGFQPHCLVGGYSDSPERPTPHKRRHRAGIDPATKQPPSTNAARTGRVASWRRATRDGLRAASSQVFRAGSPMVR